MKYNIINNNLNMIFSLLKKYMTMTLIYIIVQYYNLDKLFYLSSQVNQ